MPGKTQKGTLSLILECEFSRWKRSWKTLCFCDTLGIFYIAFFFFFLEGRGSSFFILCVSMPDFLLITQYMYLEC